MFCNSKSTEGNFIEISEFVVITSRTDAYTLRSGDFCADNDRHTNRGVISLQVCQVMKSFKKLYMRERERKEKRKKEEEKKSLTSGARNSGVPQNVLVRVPCHMPSLHNPKSAILTNPS